MYPANSLAFVTIGHSHQMAGVVLLLGSPGSGKSLLGKLLKDQYQHQQMNTCVEDFVR
jgi:ABC-type polysaccharide/polyol phosphate transport system ATPase subunit